jgi:S-(hydroxymethyl)glutathione dehydrogenase/alcohol dehydrogenase
MLFKCASAATVSILRTTTKSASSNFYTVLRYASTQGKPIKCRAAIAWQAHKPLTMEEVEVAPPQDEEVRIKIHYAAICLTDTYSLRGEDPEGFYVTWPAILGHEGAGVVESVGKSVKHLKPGDKVIPCFISQCKHCEYCDRKDTNLCEHNLVNQTNGRMLDGTSRFKLGDRPINHFMGCSTLSEYTVCHSYSVAKISDNAPLDKVCLLGCGVGTGYGAARTTANVKAESRCAVWGLGAVGLAVVTGCRNAGAKQIVAIDFNEKKLTAAKKLGATEVINPKKLSLDRPLQEYLVEKYNGGFDYTFDCSGSTQAMRQALESAHKGWGVSCITGVSPKGQEIATNPMMLLTGRRWVGTVYGGIKTRDELPELVEEHLSGKIELDAFISHRLPFSEVNKAFELLLSGESLRTIISFGADSKAAAA